MGMSLYLSSTAFCLPCHIHLLLSFHRDVQSPLSLASVFCFWRPPSYLPCPIYICCNPAQEEHSLFPKHTQFPPSESCPASHLERSELTTVWASIQLFFIHHTAPSFILKRRYLGMKEIILALRGSRTFWHFLHVMPSTLYEGLLLDVEGRPSYSQSHVPQAVKAASCTY